MESTPQMDVKVDEAEDKVDVDVVVVYPDVHVCCDMPMSIYSQFFITLSKLLRSKFQVSFQIGNEL